MKLLKYVEYVRTLIIIVLFYRYVSVVCTVEYLLSILSIVLTMAVPLVGSEHGDERDRSNCIFYE